MVKLERKEYEDEYSYQIERSRIEALAQAQVYDEITHRYIFLLLKSIQHNGQAIEEKRNELVTSTS